MHIEQLKLKRLVETEGYSSITSLLEACVGDSVSPAICTRPECDYSEEMEPDQDHGWCPECNANTMKSALVLAGMV